MRVPFVKRSQNEPRPNPLLLRTGRQRLARFVPRAGPPQSNTLGITTTTIAIAGGLQLQLNPGSETLQEESLALLKIYGEADISLRTVSKFLAAIDRIHRRFQALDTLFILLKQGHALPAGDINRLQTIFELAERGLEIPRLEAAEFHSPGFWEVLGSLSPLKFIMDCLQYWHERKKDETYRNNAEAAKLWLENELKANEVLKQRIELLKTAGVSNDELRAHFVEPMASSVTVLYAVSDSKAIDPHRTTLILQIPPKRSSE